MICVVNWHTQVGDIFNFVHHPVVMLPAILKGFGFLLVDFIQLGIVVNAQHYGEMLISLQQVIEWKWPVKLTNGIVHLQDNSHLHLSMQFEIFFEVGCPQSTSANTTYLTDISLCDFLVLDELKKALRGQHFQLEDPKDAAVLNDVTWYCFCLLPCPPYLAESCTRGCYRSVKYGGHRRKSNIRFFSVKAFHSGRWVCLLLYFHSSVEGGGLKMVSRMKWGNLWKHYCLYGIWIG